MASKHFPKTSIGPQILWRISIYKFTKNFGNTAILKQLKRLYFNTLARPVVNPVSSAIQKQNSKWDLKLNDRFFLCMLQTVGA